MNKLYKLKVNKQKLYLSNCVLIKQIPLSQFYVYINHHDLFIN